MANLSICMIPSCGNKHHSSGFCRNHKRRFTRYGDPLGGTAKGEARAFIDSAIAQETDQCILWPYAKAGAGYGTVKHDGKMIGVHRYVCMKCHGQPQDSHLEAAHKCGVANCINKRHIRWATPSGNQADRLMHGTANQGERHGHSKLTAPDIIEIRKMLKSGATQREIAACFGVHVMTISSVRRRKTWSHVKDE